VTLCDTGPLVALIDRDDRDHARCTTALSVLPPVPLLTTVPCLTEAMYLLGRGGGLPAQDELWAYVADGMVQVHHPTEGEWERMRVLMRQYHDLPMDFADASLVVAAEHLGRRRIFSLDSHFHVYRIHGKHAFEVVP
jgi:uncharacterized protein